MPHAPAAEVDRLAGLVSISPPATLTGIERYLGSSVAKGIGRGEHFSFGHRRKNPWEERLRTNPFRFEMNHPWHQFGPGFVP